MQFMSHANQQPDIGYVLQQLLQDMETSVQAQEAIIIEEREAMKIFDGDKLTDLIERRARCHSEFHELSSRCKRLIHQCNNEEKLEQVIDLYAPALADDLHSMRIDLVRRMQRLADDQLDNHVRLRAAWNVTTSILQQVGAIEMKQTYQNTYATQQAAR